jgi:aspartate carbamoyltransferase catalytic subunit
MVRWCFGLGALRKAHRELLFVQQEGRGCQRVVHEKSVTGEDSAAVTLDNGETLMAGKTTRQSGVLKNSARNILAADRAVSGPFSPDEVNPASVISVTRLTLADVEQILAETTALERESPERRSKRLRHRRVALLFYESSTRTRTSFELAAKTLGAETTLVSALSSSIEKGESLKDTGLNLKALGAEAIVLRHPCSGAAQLLAESTGLPVLNAGDGMHEHPSQALLDLRTILQWKFGARAKVKITDKTLRGVTVTICGDIFHSRVARSNALLLPRLGARMLLCGPPVLLPEIAAELLPEKTTGRIEVRRDFEECLRESDVVMMLRIQKERLQNLQLDLDKYIAEYQLGPEQLAAHAPEALVLHPGPMVRGLEITAEVADGAQSAILEQVTHGLSVRRALLVRALKKVGRR